MEGIPPEASGRRIGTVLKLVFDCIDSLDLDESEVDRYLELLHKRSSQSIFASASAYPQAREALEHEWKLAELMKVLVKARETNRERERRIRAG